MNKANVFVLLGIVTLLDLVTGQLISSIIVLCAITPRELLTGQLSPKNSHLGQLSPLKITPGQLQLMFLDCKQIV